MSDEQDKPTLTRKPLGLKRTVEAGQVQQQFSHGRRNTVVVEVKRRRVLGRPGEAAPAPEVEEVEVAPAPAPAPAPTPAPAPKPVAPRVSENDSLMSRQERQAQLLREAEEARMNALEDNRRRDEAARTRAAEEEKQRAEVRAEQAAAKPSEPEPAAPVAAAEPVAVAPAAAPQS
ncbi:MAG: translation initiation factor IF-2 associated domain-containing protein, partial [Sphingopyxis sp.]|nr:translation initiation factor IF-2 associated domain-containing protein [Sphingopyxis sp.]